MHALPDPDPAQGPLRYWTSDEDLLLRELGPDYAEIARRLGRSVESVRKRAGRLSITRTTERWTKAEDDTLRAHTSLVEALDALPHRSPAAVVKRAERLGYRFLPRESPERRVGPRGYVHVKVGGRWRYEHRVAAEQVLGRKLRPWEHVHHIDGRKDNNDPTNLFVCTNVDHARAHRSLLDILPGLMDSGAVAFDQERGEYVARTVL